MKYKSGKQHSLAGAVSCRLDYEVVHVTTVSSSITDLIRSAHACDNHCVALLNALEKDI